MSKTKVAAYALISTPLYLLLSVWGEGGFGPFLAEPAVVAAAVVTLLAGAASVFSEGNLSTGEREDKANRWILYILIPLGLLAGFLPAYCDSHGIAPIGGEAVRWLGVGIYAVGTVLRLWPVFVLGRRFSGLVAIQPGHTLVTTGIYRVIRNPSYLGLVVLALGWGLAFNSWVGVLLAVLNIPPLIARMDSEERMLASQFGAEYEAYRARTWRLVPWLY